MSRKKIIAGNWKMNMTPSEAVKLVETLKPLVANDDVDVVFCVPAIDILPVVEAAKGSNIQVGAENMYFEEKGAFTGEISPNMLTDAGVKYVVLGHSERREYFAETSETIVTSQMANAVAEHFKVKCYDCLTGFKYIAKIIRENEGKAKYIGGGEESFGYLAGDYVRDKDAVSACSLAAEAAAWAMDTMGLTLYEWLQELYVKYGFYREGLVSVVRKGKEGAELIQKMMVDFRANPPKAILGSEVVKINDFQTLETLDVKTGAKTAIEQDRSNVLQWFTADGTAVSVRPSGTEPKIKFYFGVKAPLASVADFDKTLAELDAKIEGIKKDLTLE